MSLISEGNCLLYLRNRFYNSSPTGIKPRILRWLHTKLVYQNTQEVMKLSLDDRSANFVLIYCTVNISPFLWIWKFWSVLEIFVLFFLGMNQIKT